MRGWDTNGACFESLLGDGSAFGGVRKTSLLGVSRGQTTFDGTLFSGDA
jgi:hypothetical protein